MVPVSHCEIVTVGAGVGVGVGAVVVVVVVVVVDRYLSLFLLWP